MADFKKRLGRISDNFKQDLLSTLGDITNVEWGKPIKPITAAETNYYRKNLEGSVGHGINATNAPYYNKLWTLGFLPSVNNFDAPGMQFEQPRPTAIKENAPNTKENFDDWLFKEVRHHQNSGYVKAPEIVSGEFSKHDQYFRDKMFLPERDRDGRNWMENDTWRFAIFDAVETTKTGGKRSGSDYNPNMLARLVDPEVLFGIKQMETEENMKKQHLHGYEHGKKVEEMGASLDVIGTLNKQVDYFWDDLPVKAYKRIDSELATIRASYGSGRPAHEVVEKQHASLWEEQRDDKWITKERICHVCQKMTKPEEDSDYGILPLCQKCKRLE